MTRIIILCFAALFLSACVHTYTKPMTPAQTAYLQQGERLFDEGYYKRSMRLLLPLACDGIPEAQYAVGYMYYYGYGVAQDTDVGCFWIQRAANQHYQPAIRALGLMAKQHYSP